MSVSRARLVVVLWLGGLMFALLGWLSSRLAMTPVNAYVVWPLAGLGIGLLARFGIRFWPVIFTGAFISNLLVVLENGGMLSQALMAALGIGLGNTLQAFLGGRLVRSALGHPPELKFVDGVGRFALCAAVVPAALGAGCGVLSLKSTGILPASMVASTGLIWFTGNVAGILTLSPLFFKGSFRNLLILRFQTGPLEWGIVLICLVFVGSSIGGTHLAEMFHNLPKSYMAIPLVLWIACRLGRRWTVLAVLIFAALGITGTVLGYTPFPSDSPERSLVSLQFFICVLAIIGLTVSVLAHQLCRQQKALEAALADQSLHLPSADRENAILTASAVHELQSPLSGMRNLLRLARPTPGVFAGPDGDRLLDEMQTEVERMFGLVTGALSGIRPEPGPLSAAAPEPCDITALLTRVVEAESAHAASKRIRIRHSTPTLPVVLTTYRAPLEHIASNLLSNAVKFAKPGTSVFIELERTESGVILSITDEGPGIPERDRALIFSGMTRAGSSLPTGGESSSGVGLYLSGELARRLGARLSCDAAPGGGSIFAVRIPRADLS